MIPYIVKKRSVKYGHFRQTPKATHATFAIFEAAGGNNIVCGKEFPTSADSRGQITFQCKAVKDLAKVCGIELLDV
ncbi:MAG TPA: hypothetical protein VFV38_26320 [Ktedonobacteraceae bacterium]|nr:hypothetical protein [Ktedonobacteraceae bacterium]